MKNRDAFDWAFICFQCFLAILIAWISTGATLHISPWFAIGYLAIPVPLMFAYAIWRGR